MSLTTPSSIPATSSIPTVDLQITRRRGTRAGLDQLLEAEDVRRPLGAAVIHELDRLAPAGMREHQLREVVFTPQIPADLRADPFLRTVDDRPAHRLVR